MEEYMQNVCFDKNVDESEKQLVVYQKLDAAEKQIEEGARLLNSNEVFKRLNERNRIWMSMTD